MRCASRKRSECYFTVRVGYDTIWRTTTGLNIGPDQTLQEFCYSMNPKHHHNVRNVWLRLCLRNKSMLQVISHYIRSSYFDILYHLIYKYGKYSTSNSTFLLLLLLFFLFWGHVKRVINVYIYGRLL